jgi:hypothetical protein
MTPRMWISYAVPMALAGIPVALLAYFAGLPPLVTVGIGYGAARLVYEVRERRAETKAARRAPQQSSSRPL